VVVLYRTVHHDPPIRDDFRSGKELGVPRPSARKERFWLGFSAYDSFERANATAVAYPRQGGFIAEFVVPDIAIAASTEEAFTLPAAGSITIARSFGVGHWTVWGEPEIFVPLVVRIIPVRWKEHGDHA
jgi:hypothetical protein